jgi:hypothetical protein
MLKGREVVMEFSLPSISVLPIPYMSENLQGNPAKLLATISDVLMAVESLWLLSFDAEGSFHRSMTNSNQLKG